jgi:hypothetical protein
MISTIIIYSILNIIVELPSDLIKEIVEMCLLTIELNSNNIKV